MGEPIRRLAMVFPLTLGMPGGGTFDCTRLARALARAGVEVVLLPVESTGPFRFPRPRPSPARSGAAEAAALAAEGVEVRAVPRHPLHFLLDGRPVARAVARLLAEGPLDACLGWGYEAAFLPALLSRHGVRFGMNAAASYAPFLRPGGRPLRGRRRWTAERLHVAPLRAADVVLARSAFTRGEVVSLAGVDPARVRVVPIAPDERFAALERAPAPRVTNLVYAGGFVRSKGLFDALEALGRLAAAGERGWTLRVAGVGDPETVRAAAAEHGIAGRVEVLGALGREDLARLLAWAHLALQPSLTESFGLVNAEAQAAGLAVVAYAAGAVPEVVAHGETGWLAPAGDVAALAEHLRAALADPARVAAAGEAGRARMARLFSWERTAAAVLAGLGGGPGGGTAAGEAGGTGADRRASQSRVAGL